jgi:hypothetical protein
MILTTLLFAGAENNNLTKRREPTLRFRPINFSKPIQLLFNYTKKILPPRSGRNDRSKNLIISPAPDFPSCNSKYLHEEVMLTVYLWLHNGIKEVK